VAALTPTAGRLVRPAVVLLLLVVLTAPARAAGTGGIEVSPYPGAVNGRQVTAFHTRVASHGDVSVKYSLRNTTASPARGRLYAASAVPDGKGGYTIGDAGSSPYVSLKLQEVSLDGGEVRIASFRAHGKVSTRAYAAIVVEVRNGSIVQRAATLVYLEAGPVLPLPLLIVVTAIAVLALAALGFVVVVRRRTKRPASV
jgi:hypothetical protein